jgi:hypothetical protein
VFGGLALAASGAGTYFALTTLHEFEATREDCDPACSESRVDEIRLQALLADVSLGVAAVSAGLAIYFYITRPVVPEGDKHGQQRRLPPRLDICADESGAILRLSGAL